MRNAGLAAMQEQSSKIIVHPFAEVTALGGQHLLRTVTWARKDGAAETRPVGNLFLMIGAETNTDWLDGCLPSIPGLHQDGPRRGRTSLASPYATTKPGISRSERPFGLDEMGGLGSRRGLGSGSRAPVFASGRRLSARRLRRPRLTQRRAPKQA
jgi:hypothetical protein